ncbi:MAG: YDG domain-containing protein, partial [Thermoguttaceae bacterium]
QLTVTGTTVASKTYDGTTDAAITLGAVDGIIAGDDVTVTPSGAFPSADVGIYQVVVTYGLSGADAVYYLAPAADSCAASIISEHLDDIVLYDYVGIYDALYHGITIDGLVTGDRVYYSTDGINYGDEPIERIIGETTVYVKVDRPNHTTWTGSAEINITKRQITVTGSTVSSKPYDDTTTAVVSLGDVSGIIPGDDIYISAVAEFASENVGDYDLTIHYVITYIFSGEAAQYYVCPADEIVSASITPLDILDVTVEGVWTIYDGEAHSVTVFDTYTEPETILYSTDGITYNLTSAPEYVAIGIYTTYVKVVRPNFNVWYGNAEVAIVEQLDAPTILTGDPGIYVSYGANRHQLLWTEVENASAYELSYSADGGATWNSVTSETTSGIVRSLTYGVDMTYRVRAVGVGAYLNSEWSEPRTFNVCPMDINNDGDIAPADRALLLNVWLTDNFDDDYRIYCDVDADGDIGPTDRAFLVANWLGSAGSEGLLYPPALAADIAFEEFASADLDANLDVCFDSF